MIVDEPNTYGRAMLKRSKDFDFAPSWKESFPRWRRRTPFCLLWVLRVTCRKNDSIIVNLSGRGDKDVQVVADLPSQ